MRFFFFSSRRRHTRFDCDWSSDVCSSDLKPRRPPSGGSAGNGGVRSCGRFDGISRAIGRCVKTPGTISGEFDAVATEENLLRSEERRVGEEGRSRWSPDHLKKKKNKEQSM